MTKKLLEMTAVITATAIRLSLRKLVCLSTARRCKDGTSECGQKKVQYFDNSLADLGGGCAPGTQFFHFRIHFHRKVPTSEVHAPLTGARPPYGKSWIRHCNLSDI